jgi:hypothetical protein
MVLAEGDVPGRHRSSGITREVVDDLLMTHPSAYNADPVQRRTIERFMEEIPHQRAVLEARLERFGYPELPGLTYCRLVDSVDAFADLGRASSDRMSQVGGVTYYCRYVVLPLSYVGQRNVEQLRRSAAQNPSVDVDGTIRRWQRESYASLVNTFRHELVHVHTNSALGPPGYSDRRKIPRWFHEGSATYLAADPHAGLSESYREFQNVFFFLVQRHGVRNLQAFFTAVLSGGRVDDALERVYRLSGSEELFDRSRRWHRATEIVKNALWIVALIIVIAAFKGADLPYIGGLLLLGAVAILLGVAGGLAEQLYGLRGPGVVIGVKVTLMGLAVIAGLAGFRKTRHHRQSRA